MLTVHTLGSLNLRTSGGDELTGILSQPKRLGLLVFLACSRPRGLHRRDTLLTLFWPELDEARARNSLSQSLSFLRRNLPESVLISRGVEEVGLDLSAVSVDAVEFHAAVGSGQWAEALDLYKGDFLRGFHLASAPGFGEWVEGERDRLRDAAASSAWALAQEQIRRGALVEGERTGKLALGLLCPDETTVRRFMEALAEAGDRVAALRFYERFVATLKETLDLEPTSDLEALEQRLRSGEESGTSRPLDSPSTPAFVPLTSGAFGVRPPEKDGSSLVGRETELARLGHFLDRAMEGHGTVAFLKGEAGTGKTVLSKEFCARALAAHPELVSATGYCDSHTGVGDPYHPFREILSLLTGDVDAHWMAGSMSTTHAERLWSLLPVTIGAVLDSGPDLLDTFVSSRALASRASAFGPLGAKFAPVLNGLPNHRVEASPGTRQTALFDQYARVLRRIAMHHPLLLVLEDLQWADSGSIDLLFQLGRHLDGTRILLVGLYRPSEVSQGRNGERHPLVKVANELRRTLGEVEVTLAEKEDRPFFEALIDSEPNALGKEFRDALFQRTLGHALFTIEFLRGLQDEGRIRPDKHGCWVEGPALQWDRMPAKIEAIIEERTSRLPKIMQRILTAASVEGEEFTLEVLAKVLGEDPVKLLPIVSGDLEKRHRLVQIVRVDGLLGRRISTFRFRHILFQQFLYNGLDQAEREYLHEKVGGSGGAPGGPEWGPGLSPCPALP